MEKEKRDLPLIIGGQEIKTDKTVPITKPQRHEDLIATILGWGTCG